MKKELSVVAEIAREAGAKILEFYGNSDSELKGDNSPVTAADFASNRLILDRLQQSFPEDSIRSEEAEDTELDPARRTWIVDPLDGTKEFLSQNGEFSVMIGLVEEGRPILGIVYLPALDILFTAAEGEGAYAHENGAIRPLECVRAGKTGIRLVGSRSHPDPLLTAMQAALEIDDVAPCGSVGIKCSRIAEGQRDLYIHPVPYLKEWDTCAPEVILREAGGWVGDCLGNPLTYNKPDPRQPHGIVACGPGINDHVIATIRPLYRDQFADLIPV